MNNGAVGKTTSRRAVTHLNDGDLSSCKKASLFAVSQTRNNFWSKIPINATCFYTSCCIYASSRLGRLAISPAFLKTYMAAAEFKIKDGGYDKNYLTQLMNEFSYIKGRTGRFYLVHVKLLEKFKIQVKHAFCSALQLRAVAASGAPFIMGIPSTLSGHVVVAWLDENPDFLRILDCWGEFSINKLSYEHDSLQNAVEYSISFDEFDSLLKKKGKKGVNVLYE